MAKTAGEKTLDLPLRRFEHIFHGLPFHLGSYSLMDPQRAYKSVPQVQSYLDPSL